MRRVALLTIVLFSLTMISRSQSFSINTDGSIADTSAMLDVKSTSKGVLIPRMTKAERNAIFSPATGVLIYQTGPDSAGFHYYNGTSWSWVANTAQQDTVAWRTMGNSGLVDTLSFIGNTDNVPINFRIFNQKVGRFDRNRFNYFIGRGAGGNTAIGYVSIGDSAGSSMNNNFPGIHIGFRAGISDTGENNTFIGAWAGEKNYSGYFNVGLGTLAGQYLTTGSGNTAIGMYALRGNGTTQNVTYDGNVAVGYQALLQNDSSGYNTAVGIYSLKNHRRPGAAYNTSVGSYSMENDTAGYYNVAMGTSSLRNNIDGWGNTSIGTNSMFNHKTGGVNTAIGYEVMQSDTAGSNNVAVGWRALRSNFRGYENVAVGVGSIEFVDSSYFNVALGRGAMIAAGGQYNTAIGHHASGSTDFNVNNIYYLSRTTSVGAFSGYRNIGAENTFVGYNAGYGAGADSLRGIENTGLGAQTLVFTSTGKSNTAVGMGALYNNTTGDGNVGVGTRTLVNNQIGSYNVAVGDSAMWFNNGDGNIALGKLTLAANNSGGNYNTVLGHLAMRSNSSGDHNVAIGDSALYGSSSGSNNIAIGHYAMSSNSSGNKNVAVGDSALYNNSSGSNHVMLGYRAIPTSTNLVNSTAIGSNAQVGASNSMVLGSIDGVNGATADTKVGIGTTTPDSLFTVADSFYVNKNGSIQYRNGVDNMMYMFQSPTSNSVMVVAHSPGFTNYGLQYEDVGDRFNFIGVGVPRMTIELGSGQVGIGMIPTTQLELSTNSAQKPLSSLWAITSDETLKTIEGNYEKGLSDVLRLNTIKYHYKPGNSRNLPTDEQGYGFSAQEVQKVYPEAVKIGEDGLLSLDMHPILVSYINAFKEQQKQIDDLKKMLEEKSSPEQKKKIEDQQKTIDELIKRIEKLENRK